MWEMQKVLWKLVMYKCFYKSILYRQLKWEPTKTCRVNFPFPLLFPLPPSLKGPIASPSFLILLFPYYPAFIPIFSFLTFHTLSSLYSRRSWSSCTVPLASRKPARTCKEHTCSPVSTSPYFSPSPLTASISWTFSPSFLPTHQPFTCPSQRGDRTREEEIACLTNWPGAASVTSQRTGTASPSTQAHLGWAGHCPLPPCLSQGSARCCLCLISHRVQLGTVKGFSLPTSFTKRNLPASSMNIRGKTRPNSLSFVSISTNSF